MLMSVTFKRAFCLRAVDDTHRRLHTRCSFVVVIGRDYSSHDRERSLRDDVSYARETLQRHDRVRETHAQRFNIL